MIKQTTKTVLTITPNPAIDKSISMPSLHIGRVNVAEHVMHNAGGKGINVASCLADWGIPATACGLLGESNAATFEALFTQKNIEDACLRIQGHTRTNIKLLPTDTGDTTDINLPGFAVSNTDWQNLLEEVKSRVSEGQWVLAAGSLPPDLHHIGYTPLIEILANAGAKIALDTSGDALKQALNGKHMPVLIKPNRYELEDWAGKELPRQEDLLEQAKLLNEKGIEAVAISLGADGALLSTKEAAWQAAPLPVTPISTVGAGDAQVAGLIAARYAGLNWDSALALGVAFATAKLRRLGPYLPSREKVQALADQVRVQKI